MQTSRSTRLACSGLLRTSGILLRATCGAITILLFSEQCMGFSVAADSSIWSQMGKSLTAPVEIRV